MVSQVPLSGFLRCQEVRQPGEDHRDAVPRVPDLVFRARRGVAGIARVARHPDAAHLQAEVHQTEHQRRRVEILAAVPDVPAKARPAQSGETELSGWVLLCRLLLLKEQPLQGAAQLGHRAAQARWGAKVARSVVLRQSLLRDEMLLAFARLPEQKEQFASERPSGALPSQVEQPVLLVRLLAQKDERRVQPDGAVRLKQMERRHQPRALPALSAPSDLPELE